jgi:hypothetical protein
MRYRAGLIGATLDVARRLDGGTRVSCVCACSAQTLSAEASEDAARSPMPI